MDVGCVNLTEGDARICVLASSFRGRMLHSSFKFQVTSERQKHPHVDEDTLDG